MKNPSRSIAATLALSAAILAGTGLRTTTFADKPTKTEKAEKVEKESDTAAQVELGKALTAMTDEDGPGGLAGRIAVSDRMRVADALKKANTPEYKKLVKELQDTWKDKFGHAFDADAHVNDLAAANKIDRFEYEGKQYVSITLPKTTYEPEAELRYTRNGDNMRLTLANDLTGEELAARIKRALERVLAFRDQWNKNDEVATYEGVARLMLATLDYDAAHTRTAERNKK